MIMPIKQEVWSAYRPLEDKKNIIEEQTKGGEEIWNHRPGMIISGKMMNICSDRSTLLPITDLFKKYCNIAIEEKKIPPFGIPFKKQYGEIKPGIILCSQMNSFINSLEERGNVGCLERKKGLLPIELLKESELTIGEILSEETENIFHNGLRQGSIIKVNFGEYKECVIISNSQSMKQLKWFDSNRHKKCQLATVLLTTDSQQEDIEDISSYILHESEINLSPLFSIDLSYCKDLNNFKIPEKLQNEFILNKYTLPKKDLSVTIKKENIEWTIKHTSKDHNNANRYYKIIKKENRLDIHPVSRTVRLPIIRTIDIESRVEKLSLNEFKTIGCLSPMRIKDLLNKFINLLSFEIGDNYGYQI